MIKHKILLTGASGFLGKHILTALSSHHITTIGRSPFNHKDHIQVDLSKDCKSLPKVHYDVVIHAAGLAHINTNKAIKNKDAFEAVNVRGTNNLLKALEHSENIPNAIVYISSVAVYGKTEGEAIKEDEPLRAADPYGLSKRKTEEAIFNWCEKNDVRSTILRLPLVAAKNPPGNLGAMIRAIEKGYYFVIGNGNARRSIVSPVDVAQSIVKASSVGGVYNLACDYHPSYKEISEIIAEKLQRKIRYMPYNIASVLSSIGTGIERISGLPVPLNKDICKKLSSTLTFSSEKAKKSIQWLPQNALDIIRQVVN